MVASKALATAAGTLRSRLTQTLRTRGGGSADRWTSPGHQDRPNGYLFNRPPPPPGQSRKWEDWELPCYVTSFLTIVILGVGLNAKPDLTLETWAHQKALERLQAQQAADSSSDHGGMEDTGLEIFDEMVAQKDGFQPNVEHYGCVVDLLGRSGRLEQALKFIDEMPYKPTAAIWGSLLGACRVHSNIDVGEYVGRRLLEIEPENAGNYVILSNLYASAGRWEEVRTLRKSMKDNAVTKEPGRSWMELDQTLHTFHASDRLHPRKDEVHMKVKELAVRLKEAGYEPDLSCVLYDVEEEQKEKILLGHSEKLALAFGLLSTTEGAPLRVMKNLRICVDCHNFAKFISKLYGREVSLRDKNRFHHIKGGVCSCGDYW